MASHQCYVSLANFAICATAKLTEIGVIIAADQVGALQVINKIKDVIRDLTRATRTGLGLGFARPSRARAVQGSQLCVALEG